jgi:hypothetical protein
VRTRRPVPTDYPAAATAVRPTWAQLPAFVRDVIESGCGSPVVEAASTASGFTAGFASRLLLADGSRVFVKAAGETGNAFADHAVVGYREEARKLAELPPATPAPRLRWARDRDGWVVLCFDDVGGRPPRRPWDPAELDRALDCLEQAADVLTPAPPGVDWVRLVDDFAPLTRRWEQLGDDPLVGRRADEAAALCAAGLAGADGATLLHCDLRDDNLIVADDGRIWICDWNWPMLGAPWIDTVTVLISAYGDGIDVGPVVVGRRLTRDVDPGAIDGFLALLVGYFLVVQHDPVPPTSPWIRHHQRWYGRVCWSWLADRRHWS